MNHTAGGRKLKDLIQIKSVISVRLCLSQEIFPLHILLFLHISLHVNILSLKIHSEKKKMYESSDIDLSQ